MKIYLISALLLINAFGFSQDSVFNANPPRRDQGLIFLSRDQGDTWQRADSGFPANASVNAWALSGKRVLAATEEHGVYISDDGLKSWLPSSNGLPNNLRINSLINHKNLLVLGSYRGVFVSSDEGDTWQPFGKGLDNLSARCFYSAGNKLFVGTDNGIYVSGEDGYWTKQIQGFQINTFASLNNILFAATNLGALRSEDSGMTWSLVWGRGALFNLESQGQNIISFTAKNEIYTAGDSGTKWFTLDKNFTHHTFQITPRSGPQLINRWKDSFNSLRNNQPFRFDGLPVDTPFAEIIVTPYGILVGVGSPGC